MYINIDNILKEQNKTRFWLAKQIGCHYQSLIKLCRNETSSISFDLMVKICIALNCTPNDIFFIDNKEEESVEPL